MNLRTAMAEALVDGWHGDWNMGRVIRHAHRLAEIEPENETVMYLQSAEALGVKRVWAKDHAQTWIARNMRMLNEVLWAGRNRDTCVLAAQRALGIKNQTKGHISIGVRTRDKRTDWSTVK